MALSTTADAPIPVGEVSRLIGGWIDRLGAVWVEGQITQVSRRPGNGVVFLTLRDPSRDVSISVTCFRAVFDAVADGDVADGPLAGADAVDEVPHVVARDVEPHGILRQRLLEQLRVAGASIGLDDPAGLYLGIKRGNRAGGQKRSEGESEYRDLPHGFLRLFGVRARLLRTPI